MVKNPTNRFRAAIARSQIANVEPGCAMGGAVIKPQSAKGLQLIQQASPKAKTLQKTPGRVRDGVSAAAIQQQLSAQAIVKNNRKALMR